MTDDLYEPYGRLVTIRYLGREMRVPENNPLLRCFQFTSPETVSYGDFCWNGDGHHCALTLLRAGRLVEALACQTTVADGDEILEAGSDLRRAMGGLHA
jgi:hypothetical protein